MLSADDYFEALLCRYQANFDIEKNFKLGNIIYPAYAWFYSFSEKYVLKKEAQLWAVKNYEHVFFIKTDDFKAEDLENISTAITEHVEPELVRKNGKYPEKDHMCSYMTFIIISEKTPDDQTLKAIKKFRYDKGYMFNFRGHSEARIALVALDSESIVSNYSGRDLKELMADVFARAEKSA